MTCQTIHPFKGNPTRGGSPGRYCSFCGLPLVESRGIERYDTRTGKPVIEVRRDCPKTQPIPGFYR